MSIAKNIYYFSAETPINAKVERKYLGIRGREADQLAELTQQLHKNWKMKISELFCSRCSIK